MVNVVTYRSHSNRSARGACLVRDIWRINLAPGRSASPFKPVLRICTVPSRAGDIVWSGLIVPGRRVYFRSFLHIYLWPKSLLVLAPQHIIGDDDFEHHEAGRHLHACPRMLGSHLGACATQPCNNVRTCGSRHQLQTMPSRKRVHLLCGGAWK